MSKVVIQKSVGQKQTKSGKTIYQYIGTVDGDLQTFDSFAQYAEGSEVDGTVEETQWGKTLRTGNPGGGGGRSSKSPEENAAIMRQNALTNAVAYCTAKAGMQDVNKAMKYFTADHVLQVAAHFYKFNQGDLYPDSLNENQEVSGQPIKPVPPTTPATSEEINSLMDAADSDQPPF